MIFCINFHSVYSLDYQSLEKIDYNNLPPFKIKVDFNYFKEIIFNSTSNNGISDGSGFSNCYGSNCDGSYVGGNNNNNQNTIPNSGLINNNPITFYGNSQSNNADAGKTLESGDSGNAQSNTKSKNYPSFDLNFNNNGEYIQKDYFNNSLGTMTRYYIYDFSYYNSNTNEKYIFQNIGEISNLIEVEIESNANFENNNILSFYEYINKDDYLILPTTSAEDHIKKIYIENNATLFWNKNNQLIAFGNIDSRLDFKADVTSYNYYDEKYDDGDISLLNNYKIDLGSDINNKALDFLNKENKFNLKEIINSNSIKFRLDKLLNYYKTFEEKPVYLEYFNDSNLDIYQQISLGRGGACRHRAMSFFITANSVGIPTRIVYNDVHEFVEVFVPVNGKLVWKAFNLGGARINIKYEKPDKNTELNNNQNSNLDNISNSNATKNNFNFFSDNSSNKNNNLNKSIDNNQLNLSNKKTENNQKINESFLKDNTELLNLSIPITPPIINETNSTKNESKIEDIKKIKKINYWFIAICVIIFILVAFFIIYKIKKKKDKKKNIFWKKINLKNVKKDEIDLIIETLLKEYKTNPWGVVVQSYTTIQQMVSIKMNIIINEDMTPREFLDKIPKGYDLSNLNKLVFLYEKAFFGKNADVMDAYESIKLFCILVDRRIE